MVFPDRSSQHCSIIQVKPISNGRKEVDLLKKEKHISRCGEGYSQKHGIGMTGLDRVFSPNKSRYVWMIVFAICLILTLYQCGSCLYAYSFGMPAVKVSFEKRTRIKLPRIVVCPFDLALRNPVIDKLRQKYADKFNISGMDKQQIPFSEFLKLDGINMTSLWNLYEINKETVSVNSSCSISKSDHSCAENIEIKEIVNAGGRCVSILFKGLIDSFGPLTHYTIIINSPKELAGHWSPNYLYQRYFTLTEEQNPSYTELDLGASSAMRTRSNLNAENIEIINVNWFSSPCEAANKVELCIENCIEEYLYANVPCRLPYMKRRMDLKDCDSPNNFNRSLLITREAMLRKYNCTKNCPRKCKENLTLMRVTMMGVKKMPHIVNSFLMATNFLVIQEYHQYTFNDLLANVGGTLGFFLDANILTFFEVLEVTIGFCGKLIRKNRRKMNRIPPTKTQSNSKKSNLSISGIQTIFDKKANSLRRICLAVAVTMLIAVCTYQIYQSTLSFIYGDPDVLLTTERNFSIRFPTFSVCPYNPFKYWMDIQAYKDYYRDMFNITMDNDDIPLSELMQITDQNILDFWNSSGVMDRMIGDVDIDCKRVIGLEDTEIDDKTITSVNTVNGKCLTIHLNSLIRYKGVSTKVCLFLRYLPETTASHPICLLLHNQEDDIRTLDPHYCFPISNGLMGQAPISIRKREYLNTYLHPCKDSTSVAKCQSECYDSLMDRAATCRVPFMKNLTLKPCDNADAFNKTMEAAFDIMRKYNGNWCNCPRKCQEYIYEIHRNGFKLKIGFSVIALTIPNNIFIVTREYSRNNFIIFFANICGFLGLYFGVCCLHIIEILELIWRFTGKQFRKLLL